MFFQDHICNSGQGLYPEWNKLLFCSLIFKLFSLIIPFCSVTGVIDNIQPVNLAFHLPRLHRCIHSTTPQHMQVLHEGNLLEFIDDVSPFIPEACSVHELKKPLGWEVMSVAYPIMVKMEKRFVALIG